jgi:phosphoserine phosphatase RsbX
MTHVGPCIDWAVCSRPLPGEGVSGDVAISVAGADQTVLAVIDGLGHGPEAAAAAECARDVIAVHPEEPPAVLLQLCHAALALTRGVAMTVAAIDCGAREIQWVGVGNVRAKLVRLVEGPGVQLVSRALLYSGTVGYSMPDVRVSSVGLLPHDLVLMATDGIGAGFLADMAIGQPVDRIAASILERHGKSSDDALVAVARVAVP